MSQRVTTLSFTLSKVINSVFWPILSFQIEAILLYRKTTKDTTLLAFYIHDIIEVFIIYQESYIFLYDQFYLHIVWF